jgi:hypothetical protein
MSKKSDERAYKGIVDRVRGLLATWHSAGVDVFVQLRAIEEEGTWKLGQHATFSAFLTREFPNVIGLHQYNHVCRQIDEYGIEVAKLVGPDAAHAMIHPAVVSTPARKAELVAAIKHHIDKEGCSPGLPKVRQIVRDVAPEARKPCQEVKAVRKEAREQSEVERLKERVKELERENGELKAEIERLNGLLHKPAA